MVSGVGSASLIGDCTLLIRDLIASGLTDPASAERPSNSRFVNTSRPTRDVYYPLVTVEVIMRNTDNLGTQSENQGIYLSANVGVFAKDVKQRDMMVGSIYSYLRDHQTGTSPVSGTETYGLVDFKVGNSLPFDEQDGRIALRRQETEFQYFYVV